MTDKEQNREHVTEWESGRVRVALIFEPDRNRYVVEWYQKGRARRKVFSVAKYANKRLAKQSASTYAQAMFELRREVKSDRPATMDAMFTAFVTAMEGGWRPATRTSTVIRWRKWQIFIGPRTDPEMVTAEHLDKFHEALRKAKRPMSPNQVRHVFALIRMVYRKAVERNWLVNAAPMTYFPRISRDEQVKGKQEPAEYHPDEWRRLVAVIDPEHPSWWRLGVALMLEGVQGQRIQSIRHLRVTDFDLDAKVIRWPAEYQKQGRELEQPLLSAAIEAIGLALRWRARDGYTGPWLLYAPGRGNIVQAKAGPVSYTTLHSALQKAEVVAGVPHLPYRASHGLRRMAAENVYGATRDMLQAAAWIGDRDVKQLKAYLKRTDERMEGAAAATEGATVGVGIVPVVVPAAESSGESGVDTGLEESHWSELNRRPQHSEGSASELISSTSAGSRGAESTVTPRNAPENDRSIVPGTVPDSGLLSTAPDGAGSL
jgi:integrase